MGMTADAVTGLAPTPLSRDFATALLANPPLVVEQSGELGKMTARVQTSTKKH